MTRENEIKENELKEQIQRLRLQIDDLRYEDLLGDLKKSVGKYYKHRNCYSIPQSEEDYWWLYIHAKSLGDEDHALECVDFQTDKDGCMQCEAEQRYSGLNNRPEFIEISKEEYDTAKVVFQTKLGHLL